ncbi:hypothetical protein QPK87_19675 [Kamptonema cortianum]|nr:hypothetical protein [Geitlerinema splendidum]MDK3158777.1 hypothetical protein [Kamptonema cortianum]
MRKNCQNSRKNGHTLLEALMAAFMALVCALIFSATMPVANFARGKAENVGIATSLAQKISETIRATGYPNTTPSQLQSNGIVASTTPVNIGTLGIGSSGELALDATLNDNAQADSASRALPGGRAFVKTESIGMELRRITVIVAWQEKGKWKTIRLGTLVANL